MAAVKMPAHTKQGGDRTSVVPCIGLFQVPPPVNQIPVPSLNMAKCAAAKKTSKKVLIALKETLVATSEIPSSTATPGLGKGIMSNTQRGPMELKDGASPKVYAEGARVVHPVTQSSHNKGNAPLGLGSPSQDKVYVAM